MSNSTMMARLVHVNDSLRERRHRLGVSVQEWVTRRRGVQLRHGESYKPLPYESDPRAFLANLRHEVETHVGVNHPLLGRVAHVPFTREDYLVLGLQHYPLVGTFTTYLELLLLRAPDSDAKQWIAKVLVDEYGEGSDDKDHAELYREFLNACGADDAAMVQTMLHAPMPGTKLHDEFLEDDRLDHTDWARYDTRHVVFDPNNMSRDQLMDGYVWLYEQAYASERALNRLNRYWSTYRKTASGFVENAFIKWRLRSHRKDATDRFAWMLDEGWQRLKRSGQKSDIGQLLYFLDAAHFCDYLDQYRSEDYETNIRILASGEDTVALHHKQWDGKRVKSRRASG